MRQFLIAGLVLCLSSGCATLFGSHSKSVMFTSEPSSADVLIDGQSSGKTPLTLKLIQKHDYAVTFRAPGHEDRTYRLNNHVGASWIILDVLGGLVPVVIDAATGAWYSLEDSSVHGVLTASAMPASPDTAVVVPPRTK